MPLIDDLAASGQQAEISSVQISTINLLNSEVASKLFPHVQLTNSENLSFFEFVFCNSLPKKNARGRAFTPKVLMNSFASLNDQLIDYEHMLGANGIGSNDDRVIGHVKATRFSLPHELETASAREIANLTAPLPAYGLGALFNRVSGVSKIIEGRSRTPWKVSMECGHDYKDACFLYENEFIPVLDAEIAMRECVTKTSVKPFKSRDLTLCLGGEDRFVDFWGLALTQNPADESAEILSIASGRGPELASKKIFFMPMTSFSNFGVEIANKSVDKKLEEFASLSIIGETEPDSEGGHRHSILSNLQVLPANGHSHYRAELIVTRGSSPRITGITDIHAEYLSSYDGLSSGKHHEHCHLIDIPLKGKYPTSDPDSDSEVASKEREELMTQTMEQLLNRLEKLVGNIGGGTDEQKQQTQSEIASLKTQIQEMNSEKVREEDRKAYVDGLIKEGKLVTKEVADAAVADAIKETNDANEAKIKESEIKSARLLKCSEANIDLDVEFEGVKAMDGGPMTLRKRLEMIPIDDAGEQQFSMDFALWSKSPDLLKHDEESQEQTGQQKEAASKTVKPATTAKRTVSLVGGAPAADTKAGETASQVDETPAHLLGRRAFSSKN